MPLGHVGSVPLGRAGVALGIEIQMEIDVGMEMKVEMEMEGQRQERREAVEARSFIEKQRHILFPIGQRKCIQQKNVDNWKEWATQQSK